MAGFLALETAGLNTNTNPALLPPGAMVQADNVIFARPGIVTPRPGFVDNANLTSLGTVYQMFDYNSQLVIHSKSGSTYALSKLVGGSLSSITGFWSSADPVAESIALLKSVVARKNCYFNLKTGIGKIVGTSTTAQRAGQQRSMQGKATALGAGTWLANNSYVAYKAVVYAKDANSVEVRGAPSGAVVYQNTSGGADGVTIKFPINQGVPPTTIEIYRTYSTTSADPSQEYFLAAVITVSATDITNGYVQFNDKIPDSDLGNALYTNPSQEGVAQENLRPPRASDMTLYNGMVFYSDLTIPAQTTVELLHTSSAEWGYQLQAGSAMTGDFTSGSNQILNVSPSNVLAGLSVGQVITDAANPNTAGTYIPANTKITVIAGTTVTMSANALATGATKTFNVGEVITVNGTDYYGWNDESTATSPARFNAAMGTKRSIIQSFAHVFNTKNTGSGQPIVSVQSTTSTTGTLRFEYDTDYTTSLTLKFTGAKHWSQDFTSTTTFAPYSSPGGLAVSKVDQPEHVPATNYNIVGAELERVLRIKPTRDTLWIFKTDGLYRLTGDSPDNIRIDPFNYTFNLVGIETLAVLDNKIYCFSSTGFCTVSEAGIDNDIGLPLQNQYNDALPYLKANRQYIAQFYAVSDQEKGIYLCCVPAASPGPFPLNTTQTYCYCERSQAWSTWSGLKFYVAAQSAQFGGVNMLYATLTASSVTLKRELIPIYEGYNIAYYDTFVRTLASATYNTTTGVLTAPSTSGVAAGDVVVVDPTGFGPVFYGLVTSVLSSTTLQMSIDPYDSANWAAVSGALGAIQVFRGYDCTLEYAPISGGDPNSVKLFARGAFDLENSLRVGKFTVATASDISTGYTTGTYSATYSNTGNPRPFGFLVSRNGARGTRLRLKVVINQPTVQWQYGGLRLEIQPMTERVRVK